MELRGEYGSALVFTSKLEDGAREQILTLLNQDFIKDSTVRIMPDVHLGVGSVIGFTADLKDKIIPNIVGVDIGCGMLTVELGKIKIDLPQLDQIIKDKIPSGSNVHENLLETFAPLKDMYVYRDLKDRKRIERSIGSLGSGNHFIEVGVDSKENKYLIIHSGSRNLGTQVARFYQDLAVDLCSGKEEFFKEKERIMESYKAEGNRKKIQKVLKDLEKQYAGIQPKYPRDLCYLSGKYKDQYLHDMKICQEYASLNRKTMARIILTQLVGKDLSEFPLFETVHNYINFNDHIIRKGAVSAYEGEKLLIPLNMRDGSILALGKGNKNWNYSAPHGAGRILSRTEAKKELDLEEFKDTMKGIYTTSVGMKTLDESPFAYKPMEEIIQAIGDTVEIIDRIKPLYNFKA